MVAILFLLLLSGCSPAPVADRECVSALVESRIGKSIVWNRDFQGDFTIDRAVEMALLNNPGLHASLEKLGIANADLIEAGLLQNPFFNGYVRFPDQHHFHVNWAFSITQNFIDLLLIPLRKKMAQAELAKTQFEVAHEVLELAFEVQITYRKLQAEQARQSLLGKRLELMETVRDLAEAQQKQGNISDLDAHQRSLGFLEVKAEAAKNKKSLIILREELTRLLGMPCWEIVDELPELLDEELPCRDLEALALERRWDLEVQRWELEKIVRILNSKKGWAYTAATAGISAEREPEGELVTGPAFSFALPIFNHGQADRVRLQALYRQNLRKLQEKELEIRSKVRSSYEQLQVNRALSLLYQKELLPLQEQIVSQSEQFYDAMTLGIYDLIGSKQKKLFLQEASVMALRDYWLSHIELERALGGR